MYIHLFYTRYNDNAHDEFTLVLFVTEPVSKNYYNIILFGHRKHESPRH